ncbi:MAG: peptide chain release factor N(5)-glutamine methyltransferase [Alphaproteobacteria bacterium]|nr:peptide chain release factor N(5)-glutamine methyltransferase [Alphaproteobacteria bacterium]
MKTAGELIKSISKQLSDAEIDNSDLDAKLLVAHVCEVEPNTLYSGSELEVSADNEHLIIKLVQRRLSKEPVYRIIGKREFWSLEFELSEGTLDPRPDSETIVEAVLESIQDKSSSLNIIDLGTGTGCLLLSVLSELSNARGIGVDVSENAVETAKKNSMNLGLGDRCKIVNSSWENDNFSDVVIDAINGRYDIVISNPPYICSQDIERLDEEVKDYDPLKALDGGEDGFDAYRVLVEKSYDILQSGGKIFFEVGIGQSEMLLKMLAEKGFEGCGIKHDLVGIDRCVFGEKV